VYAPGFERGGRARLARHAIRRLRARGRHVLERRRNDSAGDLVQTRARYRASCADRPGWECWSGWIGWPSATRRILIHINNTNPILDESSAESAELARRGVEVARDGNGDPAVIAAAWDREEFEAQLPKLGPRLPHPSSLQRADEFRGAHPRADPRLGLRTASTIRSTYPIKGMPRFCPIARTARCAARGYRRILDTTATARIRAGLNLGCAWRRRVGIVTGTVESLTEVVRAFDSRSTAYVNFARRAPWPEAVCSSLTEAVRPGDPQKQRLANWPQH